MTSNEPTVSASWKRPWSLNEIITFSNKWSLSGDAGVCELLKRFSSDLISEVTQVSHNVSEVQIESKQLNVFMENVSNDLCMLANDHFMENLVEEVLDAGHDKGAHEFVQNSKEEKIVKTVPLVTEALRMGLQVLENQFDMIDMARMVSISQNIVDSDTESQNIPLTNDFANNEPIYQPKDPYEYRHLPHLIGTTDFIDDDTLGIGYIDDMEEEEDAPAMSQTSEASIHGRTDFLTSSSDEEDVPKQDHKVKSQVAKDSESDDIFDTKSSIKSDDLFNEDLNNDQSKISVTNSVEEIVEERPLTLAEQLNKQLKSRLSIGAKPSDVAKLPEEPISISQSVKSTTVVEVKTTMPESSMWSNDEDEEEDIFANSKAKNASKQRVTPVKQPRASLIKPSVISDTTPSTTDKADTQAKVVQPKIPLPLTDSESEDDIFNIPKKVDTLKPKEVTPITTVAHSKKPVDVSSDNDEEDLFGVPSDKAKPANNAGRATTMTTSATKTVFKESNDAKKVVTVAKPFKFLSDDDDDDDDDIFKPVPTKKSPTPVPVPVAANRASVISEEPKKTSEPVQRKETDKSSIIPEKKKEPINAGNSSEDSESDIFTTKESAKKINVSSKINNAVSDNSAKKKNDRTSINNKDPVPVDSKPRNVVLSGDPLAADIKITQKKDSDSLGSVKTRINSSGVGNNTSDHADLKPSDPLLLPKKDTDSEKSVNDQSKSSITDNVDQKLKPNVDPFNSLSDDDITSPSPNNEIIETVEPLRPSTARKLPPGAVMMFPTSQSNHNNSLMGEMAARLSKTNARLSQLRDDNDEKHEVPIDRPQQIFPVMMPRTVKEDSPMDEKEISLDTPVHAVNQLSNLTKTRARAGANRRRPGATKKETDGFNEEVTIGDTAKQTPSTMTLEHTPSLSSSVPREHTPPSSSVPREHTLPSSSVPREHTPPQRPPSIDNTDIFANLPPPQEKKKTKKKETTKVKKPAIAIDVNEIDDIFATPTTTTTASSKKTASSKTTKKTNKTSKTSRDSSLFDDPLGAAD